MMTLCMLEIGVALFAGTEYKSSCVLWLKGECCSYGLNLGL